MSQIPVVFRSEARHWLVLPQDGFKHEADSSLLQSDQQVKLMPLCVKSVIHRFALSMSYPPFPDASQIPNSEAKIGVLLSTACFNLFWTSSRCVPA